MDAKRRSLVLAAAGAALIGDAALRRSQARAGTRVIAYKSPYCGCCAGWVEHMTASGFAVTVHEVADVAPHRERLGIPAALASCHSAEVGGYAIEGHVPAGDVQRLLNERPKARGLAVPAMVPGSPGMSGAPVPYQTLLFSSDGRFTVFARH
jgi:hypothetical protein